MSSYHSEELAPLVLGRPEHQLSRREISSNALKVLYRLHHSGYLAYLVGGGVRDILLGARPKDFDVVTSARPEEIRRLFRNSRIIGRRFRLVHVVFRDEIVEVSTFRASPEAPEAPGEWEEGAAGGAEEEEEPVAEVHGEVEAFGTPAEDARRRDFTVNALFYNIADFSVIDHVGGICDLSSRILRTIGVPERRFEEDPVRMMRALEYSVRLGFELEAETAAALARSSGLIREAAPARLSYELLEGMRTGRAAGICAAWSSCGLWERAFPGLPPVVGLGPVLEELDRRIRSGERLSDAVLIGALFLPRYLELLDRLAGDGRRLNNVELIAGLRDMLEPAAARMHVANRAVHLIQHGLFILNKLRRPPERGRQVVRLVRQDYFPVGWSLAGVAVAAGLLPGDGWRVWERAVEQVRSGRGEEEPEIVVDPVSRTRRRRRRRSRRRG